jgi:metal-responsive CopG/Arc/MetJ family transcriptional regulator
MTTQLAVRLPDDLVQRLDALVPAIHDSRSEAIRRAIELYLYRIACERDAETYATSPLTEGELAVGDGPEAWSTTPAW